MAGKVANSLFDRPLVDVFQHFFPDCFLVEIRLEVLATIAGEVGGGVGR